MTSTPRENTNVLGPQWGPAKAEVFNAIMTTRGQNGAHIDAKRVAEKAGVSIDFVRSLRGYQARWHNGRLTATNKEQTKVLAVLAALGVGASEFLRQAQDAS